MTAAGAKGRVLVAGSANVDFVVRAPHIPAPGETVLGGDLATVPGGKGANQAVASARAGGADTAMLVALGDDGFAALIERSLRDADVLPHIVRSMRPTGAALISVSDDAENAITVAPGANADLAVSDLPDLDGINVLLLQLEIPLTTVTAFARAARAARVRVVLNSAPAQALPADLLNAVDVLVANEEELAMLAGEGSIAERLAAVGVPCVVATLGARGCCALADGIYHLQPAFRVTAIDTTAAGDTFCGVLAAALASGTALPAALREASAAAALAATLLGAQTSVPARPNVEVMLTAPTGDMTELAAYCGVTAPAASRYEG